MAETIAPSGEQWTIRYAEHEAVVVEVGGGLRSYTFRGAAVLAGYPEDQQCSAGRGQLLMPWPSRIRDGRYSFDGRSYQLALSEPPRSNASHGLVRWAQWALADRTASSLRVSARLLPQQGWAWFLDLEVEYRLDDDGLTVSPLVTNIGPTAAPFGFGAHPYLTAGEDVVDALEITAPVATRLVLDEERLLPAGRSSIEGTVYDLRKTRRVGDRQIDMAYTDLEADADGCWRAWIGHPETGRRVTLWADAAVYPWLVVFTADSLPADQARRSGVAMEPMSCPPDAFNSGDDLVVLQPGERWGAPWGISPS